MDTLVDLVVYLSLDPCVIVTVVDAIVFHNEDAVILVGYICTGVPLYKPAYILFLPPQIDFRTPSSVYVYISNTYYITEKLVSPFEHLRKCEENPSPHHRGGKFI